ncbi:ABC transporter G family member 37 [Glycine soja]|uniref:V-type proton ATPase subunit a1 isoform C n=1 Tax=Glycine soja TaxID=3848 RepID=A0A445KD14_GLYSO|nr:V-type proton ATPase subunit a1 isoform C [Glycine soja]
MKTIEIGEIIVVKHALNIRVITCSIKLESDWLEKEINTKEKNLDPVLGLNAGLCQQKSEGVDRPQWSTFSDVNYSGSLSSTFGSKVSNNCDDSVLDTSELGKGLEVCADTIVGNAMLRGISGGQRKRVTTWEMLVGLANA